MSNSTSVRRRISALILVTAVFVLGAPCVSWGDALVESYWDIAYSVDYDVYVAAPDGGVNLRNGAGTEYSIMLSGLIPNGTKLHVTNETKASNGKKWGQVTYQGKTGWVFLGQCSKTPPAVSNSEVAADTQTKSAQDGDESKPATDNSNIAPSSNDDNAAKSAGTEAADDKNEPDDAAQDAEKDTSQTPAETERSADHYTPLMLVIVALLIVIAILLAVLILRGRKNKNQPY